VQGIVYVNGAFVAAAEARVSVFDRGFLFADGVYEVAAVLDGRLVDAAAHLARLERSLRELSLSSPAAPERIGAIAGDLVARNALTEGLVYIQITRGVAPRDFAFPRDVAPTLVMFTQPKNILGAPAATQGIAVKSTPDLRWARRDIKSVALLAQTLAKQAAAEAGCQEAWMIDASGYVTEGSSSTAFIVTKAGAIVTRPNSQDILPGCTRRAVTALAAREGYALEDRPFSLTEAYGAQEAFITSASTFVTPVTSIDDRPIGAGLPGPAAKALRKLYIAFARESAA